MASFREYETTGPATPRRIRSAWAIDAVSGVVVAMLAFPFPVVRAAAPAAVFVLSILSSIIVIAWLYMSVMPRLFGRTPGMYLMDLGFEGGQPPLSRSWRWALGTLFTAGGTPDTGLASRMSGLVVMSTAEE